MLIPLHDDNQLRFVRWPVATYSLIVANTLIFVLFESGLVFDLGEPVARRFGVVPADIGRGFSLPIGYGALAKELTLFTYMFLHGNWLHLISNMLFLWVFGDNIEDAMGHLRFLAFYLLCGIAGGLAHFLADPQSADPLIGASGAVAGVVAAYLVLHPRVKIWALVIGPFPFRISAMWILGFWVLVQIVNVVFSQGDGVSWWAHIGGILAGGLLIGGFKRRGVELFGRPLEPPPRVDSPELDP